MEFGDELEIDTIAAQSAKFTASLVLVHGLWSTAAIWRRAMGFLAHRGWTCHAVTLPRAAAISAANGFDAYESALTHLILKFPSPPILIGHDLGGWLALRCRKLARASIAIAPILPPSLSGQTLPIRIPRSWLGLRTAAPSVPPSNAGSSFFDGGISGLTTAEPRRVVEFLLQGNWPAPVRQDTPALVVAGILDRLTPFDAARQLAQGIGADFVSVEASHAMLSSPGWEKRFGDAHRWLIQTLGEALLVPPEEE